MGRRRAFTVIEFIVASVLTLSLVATVSVTSSTLKRTMAENRDRTAVALYAANVLETARAFNCGAAVVPGDDDATDLVGSSESDRLKDACEQQIVSLGAANCPSGSAEGLPRAPARGDGSWQPCIDGAGRGVLQPTVTLTSSWWPDVSGQTTGWDCTAWQAAFRQPAVLVRSLVIEWTDTSGDPVRRVFRDVHAHPTVRALDAIETGWIVVLAPGDGKLLSVNTLNGEPEDRIERMSVPCSEGLSIAVFPYLPAARGTGTTYVVSSADGTVQQTRTLTYDPQDPQRARVQVGT